MPEEQTLQNSNISVEIKKKPYCSIDMDITISPEVAKTTYADAFKTVKKSVSIPGFRKGKAPDSVIKSSFAKQIQEQWKQNLENKALFEACTLASIYPCKGTPPVKISTKNISLDEPSHIIAAFEAAPNVPEVDIKDIHVEIPKPKEISDERVEEKLNEFRNLYGTWSDIEGRGLVDGDYVDLNISNAKEPEIIYCENQRFHLAKDRMPTWIYTPLLGHVIGDKIEATSEKSDEIADDAEFKPTLCVIEIKAIKSLAPAVLDEAFAKKMGSDSVEALRARMREMTETIAERDAKSELATIVVDYLLEKYPFDVPQSLIETRQKAELSLHFENLKNEDLSSEETEARLRAYLNAQDFERDTKAELIMAKIARANAIQVATEDLSRGIDPAYFESSGHKQELYEKVYHNLVQQKVMLAIEEALRSKIA